MDQCADGLIDELLPQAQSVQPILRCLDDVLQLIFEEHVDDAIDPFFAAVQLSHVCQRWRALVLATPSLWKAITFASNWLDIEFGEMDMNSIAYAFATRVKHVAADITIILNITYITPEEVLPSIPFDIIYSVPSISSLTIDIRTDDLGQFADFIPQICVDRAKELSLFLNVKDRAMTNPFLAKFPPLYKLMLGSGLFGGAIASNLSVTVSHMKVMYLMNVEDLPLLALLRMVPTLQSLTVSECDLIAEPRTNPCILPNLEVLRVQCPNFPWECVRSPLIRRFRIPLSAYGPQLDGFWRFLSETPSITDVDAQNLLEPRYLIRLASPSHYVKDADISLTSTHSLTSLGMPPRNVAVLPNLSRLVLQLRGEAATPLSTLIRSRCLPRTHAQSTMDPCVMRSIEVCKIYLHRDGVDAETFALIGEYFTSDPYCSWARGFDLDQRKLC